MNDNIVLEAVIHFYHVAKCYLYSWQPESDFLVSRCIVILFMRQFQIDAILLHCFAFMNTTLTTQDTFTSTFTRLPCCTGLDQSFLELF